MAALLLLFIAAQVKAEGYDTLKTKKHFDINKLTLAFKVGHGKLVPLPIVGYSPETSLALGVDLLYIFRFRKNDSTTHTSSINLPAVFTIRGQIIVQPKWKFYLGKDRFRLLGDFAYRKYPDQFYGIGNNVYIGDSIRQKFKQKYKAEYLFFRPRFAIRAANHLFLGVTYNNEYLFNLSTTQPGFLDSASTPGNKGYFATGLGGTLEFDSRDNAFFPFKGTYVFLGNTIYTPGLGGNQSFQEVKLDVRQFFNPYGSHVIGLQLYAENNIGNVPFRMMAELGGDNKMRGYYKGLYRDKNMLMFQVEYRFPIWWKFIGVAFGGTGDVYNNLTDLSWQRLKVSGGVGLRFTLDAKERLNLRFDYAIGRFKQQGFYFGLSEAF